MNPNTRFDDIARAITTQEWPAIKAELDAGHPVCLGLVLVRTTDVLQLGQNHQVLAYGYEQHGTNVTINVYDPNAPDNDAVTMSFDMVDPQRITIIVSDPERAVYAFFPIGYSYCPPPDERIAQNVDGWIGWTSIGGTLDGSPTLIANSDGRLEVFARGRDQAVWHRWQVAPSGPWSDWASLGGRIPAGIVAAGCNARGLLEIFVRGMDGALWHRWQDGRGGWSGWTSRGGRLPGSPVVGRNADGRLEVFARGTDGAVWHTWQDGRGGWAGWDGLGDRISDDPTAAAEGDGRLHLFARGPSNDIRHLWQTGGSPPWSDWQSLGGNNTSSVAAAANGDGRLEIFARGTDLALWRRWQIAGGGWMPPAWWEGTDKPWNTNVAGDPVAGRLASGQLVVFVVGEDHKIHQRRQRAPGGGWTPWYNLQGPNFRGKPSVARHQNGQLELMALGDDGTLWHNTR
jgi:hypothetical protein